MRRKLRRWWRSDEVSREAHGLANWHIYTKTGDDPPEKAAKYILLDEDYERKLTIESNVRGTRLELSIAETVMERLNDFPVLLEALRSIRSLAEHAGELTKSQRLLHIADEAQNALLPFEEGQT